ncbi:MAG: UbiX family flavin prenyltransferase [Oscillospiraceae bacterium]|nr:UbiX family flavin prenyltransferase [Ruminococcus sp.]MCD8345304.1 UbiX family flavin prenyltransferase [Oscillospiraceae bacterium]
MAERLIVGISGASGAPLAVTFLKALRKSGIESHLIITEGGALTIGQESEESLDEVRALATRVYDPHDIGAAPASGSWKSMGMVVVPCSMKTVAGIWSGYSENLLLRAADVMLKERRKLLLVPRECPMSPIHLRNLADLSQMGADIVSPVLSYYMNPQSVHDMEYHIVGKIFDLFGLELPDYRRWEG